MPISVSYPYTLVNGTTADATQVMANFNQIQSDVNTNAAHNGANSDITSLSGLTTPLSPAQGGTGVTSLPALKTALALGAAASENLANNIGDDGSGNLVVKAAGIISSMLASNLALPGSPTTTTQGAGDNSTKVATTAYVDGAAFLKASNNLSDLGNLATALVNIGFVTSGIGANGSYKLPGGLFVKWGSVAGSVNAALPFTFSSAFPNNVWSCQLTPVGNTGGSPPYIVSLTTSGGTMFQASGSVTQIFYIAIGN